MEIYVVKLFPSSDASVYGWLFRQMKSYILDQLVLEELFPNT